MNRKIEYKTVDHESILMYELVNERTAWDSTMSLLLLSAQHFTFLSKLDTSLFHLVEECLLGKYVFKMLHAVVILKYI